MGGIVVIHGHRGPVRTNTYNSWRAMKQRCRNPKHSHCRRGVTFDPRWHSFEAFLSDMGERQLGTELARRDHDLPYCMLNCEWGDALDNHRNNRGNRR